MTHRNSWSSASSPFTCGVEKFPDLRGLAYADDGNIIGRFSQVLRLISSHLVCVLLSLKLSVDKSSRSCDLKKQLKDEITSCFLTHLKSRVVLILTKETALRITLNLDGASITSTKHTQPSHSQTSRLLTSTLTLLI